MEAQGIYRYFKALSSLCDLYVVPTSSRAPTQYGLLIQVRRSKKQLGIFDRRHDRFDF